MKSARLRPLIPETQLPFLYETNSIRAALRASRRQFSSITQRSRDAQTSNSYNRSAVGQQSSGGNGDGSIHNRLSAVLERFQTLQNQTAENERKDRPTSFIQQQAQLAKGKDESIEEVPVETQEVEGNMPATITETERAIFKHIFDNLAHGRPVSTPPSHGTDGGISNDAASSFDIVAYLETTNPVAILDELYSADLKGGQTTASRYSLSPIDEDEIAAYPKTLRKMARRSRAKVLGKNSTSANFPKAQSVMIQNTKASTETCAQVLEKISQSLEKIVEGRPKDGDLKLLDYCEEQIFPLLKGAESPEWETKLRNTGSKAPTGKAKKKKVTDGKGKEGQEEEKLDIIEAISLPEGIPAIEILSVVGPAAMLLLLRYLTALYPKSHLIFSLVSAMKAHGPTVYVLGTSTPFYNTLLAHRWHYSSDFTGMEKHLTDMHENVVPYDLKTIEILDSIREDRFFSLSRDHLGDEVEKAEPQESMRPAWWWLMEGNRTDFKTVTEEWRQRIADSLEGKEDVPDPTYGDEMLETLMRGSSQPAKVML